jgi:hypothetical protein
MPEQHEADHRQRRRRDEQHHQLRHGTVDHAEARVHGEADDEEGQRQTDTERERDADGLCDVHGHVCRVGKLAQREGAVAVPDREQKLAIKIEGEDQADPAEQEDLAECRHALGHDGGGDQQPEAGLLRDDRARDLERHEEKPRHGPEQQPDHDLRADLPRGHCRVRGRRRKLIEDRAGHGERDEKGGAEPEARRQVRLAETGNEHEGRPHPRKDEEGAVDLERGQIGEDRRHQATPTKAGRQRGPISSKARTGFLIPPASRSRRTTRLRLPGTAIAG